MKHLAVFSTLLVFMVPAFSHDEDERQAHTTATALAVPLEGIKIDGKLDDWPKNMVHYRFLNNYAPYGPSVLQKTDILNSADFSAWFMVGYSAKEQLLYVAIVVKDKDLVPSNPNKAGNPAECDATEIFIDGLHAQRHTPWEEFEYPATFAALQYVATPGPGPAYRKGPFNPEGDNPSLSSADIKKTKSRCKWSRQGNQTIYEWAVQVYDHYPTLTKIEPGKRIGFDVVVVDMDLHDGKVTDHAAWLPFGAPAPWKMFNASSLADLVFLPKSAELLPVQGTVSDSTGGGRNANLRVSVFQVFPTGFWGVRKIPMGEEQTNATGQFTLFLPPGKYVLEPAKGDILRPAKTEFAVEPNKPCKVEMTVAPLNDPSVIGKDALSLVLPFAEAVKKNKTDDAMGLLKTHPGLAKAVDSDDVTPALSFAAEKGNLPLVSAMIKAGADVNAVSRNNATALHEASEGGYGEIVALLLKNGANPEIVETEYGCTPLLWAVYGYESHQPVRDQLAIVKALVEAGAKADAKNKDGENALKMTHDADDPMRKLLLELGVRD